MRTNECWSFMPVPRGGLGEDLVERNGVAALLLVGPAPLGARPWRGNQTCLYILGSTGVASRRDLLPTVLPPLWGKVLDGNLLSTTFVKTKVLPATFVWSNVMLAIFAQSNGAAGHLRASERAAGDLDAIGRGAGDLGGVDRAAASGGRGLGRDPAAARTACSRGGESRGRRPRRRVNDDRDEGVVDVRESGVAVLLLTTVLHAPWG